MEIIFSPSESSIQLSDAEATFCQRNQNISDNSSEDIDSQDKIVEISPKGRFHRYKQEILKDKFKTIYKAFDSENGFEVAWQIVQTKNLTYQDNQLVIKEIQMLESLSHPNLIKFIKAWLNKKQQQVVIITELYTCTLKNHLKKFKQLKLKVIKSYFKMILRGINYLHTQTEPIIHRDIRSDNLFMKNNGQIVIGGLRLWAECQNLHKTLIGIPAFMAPEVFEEYYDISADIYAFGMCMLEIVTGETPYRECKSFPALFGKIQERVLPDCFYKIKDEELKKFISQCFNEPEKRPIASQLLENEWLNNDQDESNNQAIQLHDSQTSSNISSHQSFTSYIQSHASLHSHQSTQLSSIHSPTEAKSPMLRLYKNQELNGSQNYMSNDIYSGETQALKSRSKPTGQALLKQELEAQSNDSSFRKNMKIGQSLRLTNQEKMQRRLTHRNITNSKTKRQMTICSSTQHPNMSSDSSFEISNSFSDVNIFQSKLNNKTPIPNTNYQSQREGERILDSSQELQHASYCYKTDQRLEDIPELVENISQSLSISKLQKEQKLAIQNLNMAKNQSLLINTSITKAGESVNCYGQIKQKNRLSNLYSSQSLKSPIQQSKKIQVQKMNQLLKTNNFFSSQNRSEEEKKIITFEYDITKDNVEKVAQELTKKSGFSKAMTGDIIKQLSHLIKQKQEQNQKVQDKDNQANSINMNQFHDQLTSDSSYLSSDQQIDKNQEKVLQKLSLSTKQSLIRIKTNKKPLTKNQKKREKVRCQSEILVFKENEDNLNRSKSLPFIQYKPKKFIHNPLIEKNIQHTFREKYQFQDQKRQSGSNLINSKNYQTQQSTPIYQKSYQLPSGKSNLDENFFAYTNFNNPLARKCKNSEQNMKKLQKALELIFGQKIQCSQFNKKIEKLVKIWQERNQYTVDGIVNQKIWDGILNEARNIYSRIYLSNQQKQQFKLMERQLQEDQRKRDQEMKKSQAEERLRNIIL